LQYIYNFDKIKKILKDSKMRLQDYVKQTIIEISEGVKQAQLKTDDNVKVNPKRHSDDRLTEIEFNINADEISNGSFESGIVNTGDLEISWKKENTKPDLNFKINVILPEDQL